MLWLALIIALPVLGLALLSFLSKPPENLGVENGRLAACPGSPNCVSTQADDESHRMDPIAFTGTAVSARARLKQAILSLPRSKIVEESDTYLHVEFTTAVMRFVDDAEFLIDAENQQIHFRSAARVGYSDFGANRKRMNAIRLAFEAGA
jgi:uncharacterized protein (DUF1499 family)